ncbi:MULTISPECIES: hypothetical protein [Microvirga]|uniref:hypothetical protein n=1 Tax=Microvirga TaxID=186650 RepID=UPI0021C8E292|nr:MULTISPECIES: hypothetical protein [unclassified Microvirga]
MLDRQQARSEILEAVREMAREYPQAEYGTAREQSGLLGRIKRICENIMPTARLCWEFVGLDRSKLVDEFTFTQEDLRKASPGKLYPHQEKALKALRQTSQTILQVR